MGNCVDALRRRHRPLELWFLVAEGLIENLKSWSSDVDEDGEEVEREIDQWTGRLEPCERTVWLRMEGLAFCSVGLDTFFDLTTDLVACVTGHIVGVDCDPLRKLYIAVHRGYQRTESSEGSQFPDLDTIDLTLREAKIFGSFLAASRGWGRRFGSNTPTESSDAPASPPTSTAAAAAPPPSTPAPSDPRPNLCTLRQAASVVNVTKGCLEKHKRKTLPDPKFPGGGGRCDLYDWPEMRAWLAATYKRPIDSFPERLFLSES